MTLRAIVSGSSAPEMLNVALIVPPLVVSAPSVVAAPVVVSVWFATSAPVPVVAPIVESPVSVRLFALPVIAPVLIVPAPAFAESVSLAVKVVLPTALGGIVTGVTLAIARVVGETAPLLLIAGLTTRTNFNVFAERMTTLPVLIYTQNANPGIAEVPGGTRPGIEIAWAGALVLIVIVMVLNLVARIIGRIFAPKTGH